MREFEAASAFAVLLAVGRFIAVESRSIPPTHATIAPVARERVTTSVHRVLIDRCKGRYGFLGERYTLRRVLRLG